MVMKVNQKDTRDGKGHEIKCTKVMKVIKMKCQSDQPTNDQLLQSLDMLLKDLGEQRQDISCVG